MDCGLERPPWKISSEKDDDEVEDGESEGGIMSTPARGEGELSLVEKE